MRDQDPELDPAPRLDACDRGKSARSASEVDTPLNELQDLLEKWEERFLKREDASLKHSASMIQHCLTRFVTRSMIGKHSTRS